MTECVVDGAREFLALFGQRDALGELALDLGVLEREPEHGDDPRREDDWGEKTEGELGAGDHRHRRGSEGSHEEHRREAEHDAVIEHPQRHDVGDHARHGGARERDDGGDQGRQDDRLQERVRDEGNRLHGARPGEPHQVRDGEDGDEDDADRAGGGAVAGGGEHLVDRPSEEDQPHTGEQQREAALIGVELFGRPPTGTGHGNPPGSRAVWGTGH